MAKTILRKLTKRFFLIPTIIACGIFLVGCLSPYLNPKSWWWIGFLSLLQPYLIAFILLSFIFWLAAKPIVTIIPIVTLLIGMNQIKSIFAFRSIKSFNVEKSDTSIRIVTWNVGNLNGLSSDNYIKNHSRSEIASTVLNLDPDIICLQEFNHSVTQGPNADNIGLFEKNYPFHYFSKDINKRNGFYQAGSIIFSKLPIVDSGRFQYPNHIKESFMYADIKDGKDTFRIYNVHLQSFKFKDDDYSNFEKIKNTEENPIKGGKSIFFKMKTAFTRRGIQAAKVREETDKSPYQNIICGDFNDVPGSYVYMHIRGYRNDAFLQKSFGIGRTYISLAPTLRIDYILPDQKFTVNQFDMIDEGLSDHIMLVSDLSIKK
jgi:endonuclease/exonuclease/phosphatase family metal-dependent hydrolase